MGSYALEGLVRSGVGNIRIVDYDKVSVSNINRQLIALGSTIGKPKVIVAKERILDINPDCNVEIFERFVHDDTLNEILDNNPDMVVDAIDSLSAKVALITFLHKKKINFISSMGAALKKDPSKIKVGNLFESTGCHLARVVKKRLRRNSIFDGVISVYSNEVVNYNFIESDEIIDGYERGRNRRIMGSLPTITGIFGLTIANYVIQNFLNKLSPQT